MLLKWENTKDVSLHHTPQHQEEGYSTWESESGAEVSNKTGGDRLRLTGKECSHIEPKQEEQSTCGGGNLV